MWGNLHGWVISACLAVLILLPIGWLARMSGISAPSGPGADPANLQPLALPVNPDDAWPLFTDESDAGPPYAKAIAAWNDDADRAAGQFMQSPTGEAPVILNSVLDARHCRRMTLFSANPPELINYNNDHPRLETINQIGQWCWRIGLSLSQHGRAEEGRAWIAAAYALGRQLYADRLTFDEYQKGTQLMADAAEAACQTVPRGSELYDRLSDFEKGISDYQDHRIVPIWQVLSSVSEQVIAASAGDAMAFATNSKDRLWRVEGTLALGRLRFNAGTLGDQIGAARALHQLADDPDPAVATAAKAALGLTIQDYRMIH